LVFLDESGFQLTPLARRTLAPMGQTPVLDCLDRRDRVSVISAIMVSAIRAQVGLVFRILWANTNAKAKHIVEFLRKLKRSLGGPMTVVWDRSAIHSRSKLVQSYLVRETEIVAE
ncbi:MAG: transposase, partial [Gemmataceae bacterium]